MSWKGYGHIVFISAKVWMWSANSTFMDETVGLLPKLMEREVAGGGSSLQVGLELYERLVCVQVLWAYQPARLQRAISFRKISRVQTAEAKIRVFCDPLYVTLKLELRGVNWLWWKPSCSLDGQRNMSHFKEASSFGRLICLASPSVLQASSYSLNTLLFPLDVQK